MNRRAIRFNLAAFLVLFLSIGNSAVLWFEIRNWLWFYPELIWVYRLSAWPFLGAIATLWYWYRH